MTKTVTKKKVAWYAALVGAILLIGATIAEPGIVQELPFADALTQMIQGE